MPQKSLLATAKLITLPIWHGRLFVLPRDAIPKVLDKLQTFGAAEFEEGREFRIHTREIEVFSALCNNGR